MKMSGKKIFINVISQLSYIRSTYDCQCQFETKCFRCSKLEDIAYKMEVNMQKVTEGPIKSNTKPPNTIPKPQVKPPAQKPVSKRTDKERRGELLWDILRDHGAILLESDIYEIDNRLKKVYQI